MKRSSYPCLMSSARKLGGPRGGTADSSSLGRFSPAILLKMRVFQLAQSLSFSLALLLSFTLLRSLMDEMGQLST